MTDGWFRISCSDRATVNSLRTLPRSWRAAALRRAVAQWSLYSPLTPGDLPESSEQVRTLGDMRMAMRGCTCAPRARPSVTDIGNLNSHNRIHSEQSKK